MTGYWHMPQATTDPLVEASPRAGDLGRVDDKGFLFSADRARDRLIRGGEGIYRDTDNVPCDHPSDVDVTVVGIPHPTLGDEPDAIVYPRVGSTTTQSELHDHVRDHLAAFRVPVKVRSRPERLPRTDAGKIVKSELKLAFAAHP